MWLDWINDDIRRDKDYHEIQQTMSLAVRECPSVSLWEKYGQFLVDLYNKKDLNRDDYSFLRQDMILSELAVGTETTSYYIPDSHRIWNIYMEFQTMVSGRNPEVLKTMYLQRLAVPHAYIEDTFSQYSTFITAHYNNDYEEEMLKANKIYAGAKKAVEYRDKWEIAIRDDPAISLYAEYIQWEQKRPKKYQNQELVKALYERALLVHPFIQEIWDDYLLFLCDKFYSQDVVDSVVDRSVKACPWSGTLWAHKIRLAEVYKCDEEEMFVIVSQLSGIPYFNSEEGLEEWKIVRTAWLSYLYRLNLESDDAYKEQVVAECTESVNRLVESKRKSYTMDLEQIIIEILTKLDCMDLARQVWEKTSKYHGKKSEFWIKWFQWEQVHGDYQSALDVINTPMSRNNIDWPERITQALVDYERINGTAYSTQHSIVKSRQKLKMVAEKRVQQEQQQNEEVVEVDPVGGGPVEDKKRAYSEVSSSQEPENGKASKATRTSENPSRDREHNSVVVTGLPSGTTEEHLRKFFADCGEMKSIYVSFDSTAASIEFSSHDYFLSALTKNQKNMNGSHITVVSGEGTTLWVTNFPAAETEQSMVDELSNYGTVVSIRFPSLKYNTNRRFCYVQLASQESAQKAVAELDGKPFRGAENIVVKISDPSKKQERTGPLSEGRELIVKGIDFKTVDENQVRSSFEKYGQIQKIHLPLANKSKKGEKLHDGYAFITFSTADEATSALAMNGVKLGNRYLNVSKASKNPPRSNKRIQSDPSKILKVNNVSDTVNQEQLKTVFEKVAPVVAVQISPKNGTATVEFNNISVSSFVFQFF
ncbi:hypothetical protein TRICI_002175 [Trichomonascus ciferrii]|uniref:U4/U6 snRNA-associated-splicing factor PRP24 n=1 Tax=Trichomonascus ciferrii TaxID=44093 RepID=A0A642V7P3_9ASCO|nr:hypothetical protein TRICI_002175 [Trichomonascus ciferrii]